MSVNTISLAEAMTKELDKAVVQKPATGFLVDNNLRSRFVGAGTVMIPEMAISGLGDYDRDTGFANGTIAVTSKPYTLSMDRGRSFQLDQEDNDESGVLSLAGSIMGEFVRTQVVPEMDAYVLSKLAGYATTKTQTVTGTVATQAYKMLSEAMTKAQNAVGYDEELVCFVNSTMWAALNATTELSRQIVNSDFKKGEVDLQVKSLNGVSLLPVPDSRMKSAYTFLSGKVIASVDGTAGGFTPAAAAKNIGFILMPKRGASLVKKTEKIRTFDPAHNVNADAWKFDYRLYYDVFIRDNIGAGIYTYTY